MSVHTPIYDELRAQFPDTVPPAEPTADDGEPEAEPQP
ncbi:hypothetical protein Actkin_03322 [Actinokineospora sp. UTMC 2448]|nr:hypothetical protein Actkin_03322 [Actinokineospora sp. UTMC 2448]